MLESEKKGMPMRKLSDLRCDMLNFVHFSKQEFCTSFCPYNGYYETVTVTVHAKKRLWKETAAQLPKSLLDIIWISYVTNHQ